MFSADFRKRSYAGVTLAYAGPIIAPEPWELFVRIAHTKAAVDLLLEHHKLDTFIDRLGSASRDPSQCGRLDRWRTPEMSWSGDPPTCGRQPTC